VLKVWLPPKLFATALFHRYYYPSKLKNIQRDDVAYQVLSRKWRPKKFEDVVGQEHVTRSIQNAIVKDKLGHAYILTGTRGIGKTSVARIFAQSLRCENRDERANPCGECRGCQEFATGSSMNVFEIDGASNNSVDDVRELVNNVQTLPTFGDHKVYIIDEVHMLSTSAFNALLKTLEEPPAHTIFLLATTEPHKLLDTVLSRCIRFDFRNASVETLTLHLKKIAEAENIQFQDEKLFSILAQQGNGSFRDTLSLLDQVLSFCNDNIVEEVGFSTALGLAKLSTISDLGQSIIVGDSQKAVSLFNSMLGENVTPESIVTSLLDFYFDLIQEIDTLENLSLSSETMTYLKTATMDEVFWVYESLSRDFTWALESLAPEKTINIIIQKHARRGDLLKGTGMVLGEVSPEAKKKVEIEEEVEITPKEGVQEEPAPQSVRQVIEEMEAEELSVNEEEIVASQENPNEEQEPPKEEQQMTGDSWEGFEEFLKKEIPAIFAELEHGNLLGDFKLSQEFAFVEYGFSAESKLFYDHLISGDGKEKIENMMKGFFKVPSAEIKLTYLEKEDAEEQNFLSKSEIYEQERLKKLEEKEQTIRTHPVIQEAEKLFGKTVDKVKVKE
jgi:DNA polymerase-3 subunit gamma/tau